VVAIVPGYDDIDSAIIVELIDFITASDDRHIPAQKIDEHPLTLLEHGAKQVMFHGL
jgi:hypothetical protein